jgi:hypothetical protein
MTDWAYKCRVRIDTRISTTSTTTAYEDLYVSKYKKSGKNSTKFFHPMMLSYLNTTLNLNGHVWPALAIDFSQWDETFTLTCYPPSDRATPQEIEDYLSGLRNRIIMWQTDPRTILYMQMIQGPVSTTDATETVHCDPIGNPYGMSVGRGYRGMFTTLPEYEFPAEKRDVPFTLTFKPCMKLL